MLTQAKTILKNTFGYDEFRPLQADIINNILQKKDTLVIMPTGGGKSICYQIPALIFEGLTVVVSPLIALMKDQVGQMQALGVRAAFLNSSLSVMDYNRVLDTVSRNQLDLLYVAPETLLKDSILNTLTKLNVASLTIDEAHCISEWGHDFRPEYRLLAGVRERFNNAVCVALTATATPRVRIDIKQSLAFADSAEYLASFNRENLNLHVVPKTSPAVQMIDFLRDKKNEAGIIYCATRQQTEDLAHLLTQEGFSAAPYHAGMSDSDRTQNQDRFIRDDVRIIVATIAFGMGINKSNIRYIVHYDLPKNIESYYQQIGRAGRDGLPADCLLLFGYGDVAKIKYFMQDKSESEYLVAQQQLGAILRFADSPECRRKPLLAYFGETYLPDNCGMCDNCQRGQAGLADVTVAAQKFLSCVYRTREIFGASHIIDVLRGSKSKKVVEKKHDKLSTYGIGLEFSKKQWQHLAGQFISRGLLTQDMEYGSLKLTERGWAVLRGQEKVTARVTEDDLSSSDHQTGPRGYDPNLLALLREKRKELAGGFNLPPYHIFNDKTLVEMATNFPQTKESMLAVSGVGEFKFERYGYVFLQLIRDYAQECGLTDRQRRTLPAQLKSDGKKRGW